MSTVETGPMLWIVLCWVVFANLFLGMTAPAFATPHEQSANSKVDEGIRDALSRIWGMGHAIFRRWLYHKSTLLSLNRLQIKPFSNPHNA